ncbi:MAG TPA: BON domain-containing protein [Xanthomonadales bacterium]|nr:BON domain-containing protein [Xanthomonadales bacterium]
MKSILTISLAVLGLAFSNVHAQGKTAGEHIDDSWIHTKVKAAMVGHGSSGVNVEVYDGVVQLAGFLTGKGNKQNIIDAASGVEGVKSVSDKLQVVAGDRSAGRVIDDNTATARVKAALIDADLLGINVEVNRGNVLLSGFVDNDKVRQKAIDTTKAQDGVAGVIDGMDIKP